MLNYAGICRACFNSVQIGQEFTFKSGTMLFHKSCVDNNPNGYYVSLERIKSEFKTDKKTAAELMDELEELFKIPTLNDPDYNEKNQDVMTLYLEIVNSRKSLS